MRAVARDLQIKYGPALWEEIKSDTAREIREKMADDNPPSSYGNPFGGSPNGGSSPSGSGGKSSGSSNRAEPSSISTPGGNPLDILRGEEAKVIQPSSEITNTGLESFEGIKPSPVTQPTLARASTTPERSSSPILRNLQMLTGQSNVPGSIQNLPINTADTPTPQPEKSVGIAKGNSNTNSGIGEPMISPEDSRQDSRFDFSAKAPDTASAVNADNEPQPATSSSGGNPSEEILSRQVLPIGPADEKGRSWIFSYSPQKIVLKTCDSIANSLINHFCISVRRQAGKTRRSLAAAVQ